RSVHPQEADIGRRGLQVSSVPQAVIADAQGSFAGRRRKRVDLIVTGSSDGTSYLREHIVVHVKIRADPMSWKIRRIRPDEGLRALRLHALADAPEAFGLTLAREEAFPEEVWHERA